jgi:hypothetical protein
MSDINYFEGIVKILETPTQQVIKNNFSIVKVRAQLPQVRNTKLVTLIFWTNLARDIADFYKANDYIIIEGYLSLPKKLNSNRVEITALKVYPFSLNSKIFISKT